MQHRNQRRHTSRHQRTLPRRGIERNVHTYRGWEHGKEADNRATTSSGRGSTRYRSRAHAHLEDVAGRQSFRHHRIRSPGIACIMRITISNAKTILVMHKHNSTITSKRHTSKEEREQSRKWRWSSRHYKLRVAGGNTTGSGPI